MSQQTFAWSSRCDHAKENALEAKVEPGWADPPFLTKRTLPKNSIFRARGHIPRSSGKTNEPKHNEEHVLNAIERAGPAI